MALSGSGAQTEARTPHHASAELAGPPKQDHRAPLPVATAAEAAAGAVERSTAEAAPATLPAMFWDMLPEGESQHPDKLAMDAIMEELSPAERAANFKVHSGPRWHGCMRPMLPLATVGLGVDCCCGCVLVDTA